MMSVNHRSLWITCNCDRTLYTYMRPDDGLTRVFDDDLLLIVWLNSWFFNTVILSLSWKINCNVIKLIVTVIYLKMDLARDFIKNLFKNEIFILFFFFYSFIYFYFYIFKFFCKNEKKKNLTLTLEFSSSRAIILFLSS